MARPYITLALLFLAALLVLTITVVPSSASNSKPIILGHVRVGHGAEPVFIIHEWMGDHHNFDLMHQFLLTGDKYSWFFADLRGYGLSKEIKGAYTLEEAANDVIALVNHYHHEQFHIIGHSMSGMIAQYITLKAGARVKSTTLISPVPPSGYPAPQGSVAYNNLLSIVSNDTALRNAIISRGGALNGEGWIERKMLMTRRACTRAAMIGYLNMFTSENFADQVRGITTPVSVVCGAYDLALYQSASLTELLTPLYPNLNITVDHQAGHYSMLETPPFLSGQFLNGVSRGISQG